MKNKFFFCFIPMIIIVVISCSVCTSKQSEPSSIKAVGDVHQYMPYEQLPEDYGLEDAKSDGCVVFENHIVTSGAEVWQKFIKRTENGEKAKIRLAFYYTMDEQDVSEEYYAEEKDGFPIMYIQDLSFDGMTYRLYYTIDADTYQYEYPYLVKHTGTPSSKTALYNSYVYYYLVRDEDITYNQIERGMYSSQMNDWVDCKQVYADLID
jgi:hypothetical protein